MKENNNIDELFRKGTEQNYPVDESLWSAVESQLPQQITTRSPWFYSLNSIVFLVVLVTCSFIPKDNSRSNSTKSENSTINETALNPSEIILPKSEQLDTNSKTSTNSTLSPSVEEKTNPTTHDERINQAQKQKSNAITKTLSAANTASKTSHYQSSEVDPIIANIAPPASKSINPVTVSTSFASEIKVELEEQRGKNNLLPIPLLTEFINMKAVPFNLNPKGLNTMQKQLPSNPYYNVELEALLSVAISKTLKDGEENIIETKRSGENSVELRSLGLNLIGQKKFFIYGAGIQQSQYLERFTYNIDVEKNRIVSSYDTNFRVVNGSFNSNGTPVLLIKQQITENQRTEEYVEKDRVGGVNTIKWIGIPLFVGVQKNIGNWQASVRFSIITQYSYHQSGFDIADDLNNLNQLSDQEITSVHFSNRNDLSVGYNLNEQFVFGAKYALFGDINSFTKKYNSTLNGQLIGIWIQWKP